MHSKRTSLTRAQRRVFSAALLLMSIAAVRPAQAAGVVSTCDQPHLQTALSGGGLVTVTCSGDIALTTTLTISLNTTIDATGQTVTLDGQNSVQVLSVGSGVTLTLNNLTIANGSDNGNGGAGVFSSGTLIVTKGIFSGNKSSGPGGAIFVAVNGKLIVNNSSFSGNQSGYDAGAIWVNTEALGDVTNSTFSGNSALYGGAIGSIGTLTVTNSTFSGNTANADGAAIYSFTSTSVTLTNTILAGNTGNSGTCGGTIIDGGYNLSDDGSCNFTATGSTNSDGNINLGSFSNGVFPLNTGSDAIGAIPPGTNGCATTILTDQIGQARPGSLNGNCSIGAWEYVAPVTSTITDCSDDSQLQTAVQNGGRIVFACSGDIKLTATLTIASNTAMDATGQTVTLDGQGGYQVIQNGAVLGLNNLTIANGNATNNGNGQGGAVYSTGTLVLSNSAVRNNSSYQGGGIDSNGPAIITNSTLTGNNSPVGGAIFSNAALSVTNSTISGNSVNVLGSGIYQDQVMAILQNTIVANNNGAGDCFGTFTDAGYNLADDSSCGFTQPTSTVTTASAINLGSLSSNGGSTQTIPLLYPSVAIDAIPPGTNGCGMSPDQRGVFRPQGAACDIGAYEANQIPVAFATSPANLSYNAGSINYTAAAAPFLVVGAQYTIATTSPQSGGTGTQYAWQNWSDNGAQSHSITIPSGPASYTANFLTQYLLTTAVNPSSSGKVGVSPTSTNGYYDSGTPITLTASANSGYGFTSWSGTTASTTNPLTFNISAPTTETANFSQVAQVKATVATNPSGLAITVDGQTYTSPQTFNWALNSKHTIAAASLQTLNGLQYGFVNWSDRGALSHQVTASANATYTATFDAFTITPDPSSETVSRGHVAAFALQLKSINGFKGDVKLSCSGGPAGSYCADLPQTVYLNGQALAVSGIFFPTGSKPGTYTMTFSGTSSPLTESATATFTVK